MRPSAATVADVAVTMACIVFVALGAQRLFRGDPPPQPARPRFEPVKEVQGLELDIEQAETRGASSARLVLVEFADYLCPFCRKYSQDTRGFIESEFVETGLLQYAFMHYPITELHPFATRVSQAAVCAGAQGQFWQMHSRLFAAEKLAGDSDLASHAVQVGLNPKVFEKCLADGARGRVEANFREGRRAGITSTPTFLLGVRDASGKVRVVKQISGAQPADVFRKAFAEASTADQAAASGAPQAVPE